MKKLFAGIHTVGFSSKNAAVAEMKSQDGEIVPLAQPVMIETNVEAWLGRLATEMKSTLEQLLAASLSVCCHCYVTLSAAHICCLSPRHLLIPINILRKFCASPSKLSLQINVNRQSKAIVSLN